MDDKPTEAGDERTQIILLKKFNNAGCLYCKSTVSTHTYLTCPSRPCYLCKKPGHLSNNCPYRALPGAHEAALKALLSSRQKRAHAFHLLRSCETDFSLARTNPAQVYWPNPQFRCKPCLKLNAVHAKRITVAEWHSEGRHFVTGDKVGLIKVWNVGNVEHGERGNLGNMTGDVARTFLHHCNVNVVTFDKREPDKMYTSSSDGVISAGRLALMGNAANQFRESVMDREVVLDMNPNGFERGTAFKMAYGMSYSSSRGCLYIGASNGCLWRRDPREDGRKGGKTIGKFHTNKVTCIDVNPSNQDLVATASNDKTVRFWDARKFAPGHELGTFEHGRIVSSAYFSPNTGAKLLTTSMDNRIRVWNDIYGFTGNVNDKPEAQPLEIVHSHDFHRYLNPFRATWDPKDWRDDLFMCGRFLGDAYYDSDDRSKATLLYPIDMFSAKTGSLVHSLVDPVTELRCTTNRFNPMCDMILTAASANVVLWRPPKMTEEDGDSVKKGGSGGGSGPSDNNDGNDDNDDDDDDDDDDAHTKKRRKLDEIGSLRRVRVVSKTSQTKAPLAGARRR